jgi:hypothetical protein
MKKIVVLLMLLPVIAVAQNHQQPGRSEASNRV